MDNQLIWQQESDWPSSLQITSPVDPASPKTECPCRSKPRVFNRVIQMRSNVFSSFELQTNGVERSNSASFFESPSLKELQLASPSEKAVSGVVIDPNRLNENFFTFICQ